MGAPGRGGATGGARYTGRGPVWGTIKRRGACAAVPGCPGRAGAPGRATPWPRQTWMTRSSTTFQTGLHFQQSCRNFALCSRNLGLNGCGGRRQCVTFFECRYLVLDHWLGRLRCASRGRHVRRRGRSSRYRRLRRDNDGGRWARHRLRRNETRRRLGRLRRSHRRCTCNRGDGFRNGRRGTDSRRRSDGLPWSGGSGQGRRSAWSCSRRLGGPLRDRLQHIAGLGDVRQVKLGLEFVRCCARRGASSTGFGVLRKVLLDLLRFIHFDGTGVRLLFGYADLDESVEDHLALYLEFPCQVINSNLLHSALSPPYCPVRLSLHSILTVEFRRPA